MYNSVSDALVCLDDQWPAQFLMLATQKTIVSQKGFTESDFGPSEWFSRRRCGNPREQPIDTALESRIRQKKRIEPSQNTAKT